MDHIYKNIEEYNPNKKRKTLIVFDDIIAYIHSNERFNQIVTELYVRGKKLITSCRLNCTNFFMKITNKGELQHIAFNHSSDIDFQDFMNLYKKCAGKPYAFLVGNATLASANSSGFRENLLERM